MSRSKKIAVSAEARAFLAEAGRKGGKTKGASKLRGDREYYSRISAARKSIRRKNGEGKSDEATGAESAASGGAAGIGQSGSPAQED